MHLKPHFTTVAAPQLALSITIQKLKMQTTKYTDAVQSRRRRKPSWSNHHDMIPKAISTPHFTSHNDVFLENHFDYEKENANNKNDEMETGPERTGTECM